MRWRWLSLLALLLAAPAAAQPDGAALYAQHCAACHGGERLGGMGPALLPENMGRLRPAQAATVIAQGRAATRMPGFADQLSPPEIEALAAHIFRPAPANLRWDAAEIEASRQVLAPPERLPARPVFDADPLNLFLVVETGDHHVTVLDGDRFAPIHRFPTRPALHGGPKFSPDGRFTYLMSRDGWVTKYDIHGLQPVAEVRVGINSRNLALSSDGRFVAVANYLPRSLVLLDAGDLSVKRVIPAVALRGGATSRVSAVYDARPRRSFVVAMKDIPEIWEVSYDDNAPPVFTGLVHNYEKGMVEGLAASQGLFALRRIAVEEPLDDFMFDPAYRHLLGSAREGKTVVVNLTVGRPVAEVPLEGLPHLGSGITWTQDGRRLLATPNLRRPEVSVIDMADWKVAARIPTDGPGFFLRSHERTPYAWTDSMMGGPGARDTIQVIDKRSLEVVRRLRPAPGRTAAHVEFTRDGRYALVSVWEDDGAVVVYDAESLAEVTRLPMRKPSGKYNVFNKITLSEGTSH
ncbi:nitrite reductase [Roseicella aquatilis]|uniref:Cytochrome C oxidase Cbb3 n=1 Tax=Roseicella aquatilis TaxID=2527868 RepID=A0A4R4D8A9_9PROT|nr:nitrite reductase [Roseicella aquatilis]TCZ55998.1 cytochrome C oxidase Cbb3 [Roseicella aquatilis]